MAARKNSRKGIKEIPLRIRAEMALKEAVAEAIAEHKKRGEPIVVWRNGKVVLVPPDEIVVPVPPMRNKRGKPKRGNAR